MSGTHPGSLAHTQSSQGRGNDDADFVKRVGRLGHDITPVGMAVGLALALFIHGAGLAAGTLIPWEIRSFAMQVQELVAANLRASYDIEPEPVEVPEEQEEPEPVEPEIEAEPPEEPFQDPETAPSETSAEPAPAAAEAGEVLTSEPDPSEPLDLTDQGFISGTGTRFSGGVTAAQGTSTKAVRKRTATAGGTPGGKGTGSGQKPPSVDRSRPAGLLSASFWNNCGFPPEADAEQVNQASVQLVVTVSPSGKPQSVSIVSVSQPGLGFERVARTCALRTNYQPGLDRQGNPTTTTTPPFRVRFTR